MYKYVLLGLLCTFVTAGALDQLTPTHTVTFTVQVGDKIQGDIKINMFGREVPKTVQNFVTLCEGNIVDNDVKLAFEGSKFHRIIPNFMIQGGDFTRGDGTGGRSIWGLNSKTKTSNQNINLSVYQWLMLAKIQMEVNFLLQLLTQIGWMEDMLFSVKLLKVNKLSKQSKLQDHKVENQANKQKLFHAKQSNYDQINLQLSLSYHYHYKYIKQICQLIKIHQIINLSLSQNNLIKISQNMQNHEISAQGMQVEIDQKKAHQYNQLLRQFELLFRQMQQNFQQSQDNIYYIVSHKFIKEWKLFCSASGQTRIQPMPMNFDIVDQQQKTILEGLNEAENYEIVNQKIFQLFTNFTIFETLRRVCYGGPGNKVVPIRVLTLNFLTLSNIDLQLFDKQKKYLKDLKLKTLKSISQNNTVTDFLQQVQAQESVNKHYKLRLWKHEKQITLQILYEHIVKQCKPKSYAEMKIRGKGKMIQNNQTKFAQLDIKQGDYFVVQCIENDKVVITSPDQGKCQQCYNYKKLTHHCPCKNVAYCSQECMNKDKVYHTARCRYAEQQELKKPIQMIIRQKSRRGVVGLENLGNTCFMNSCLQCLSHTLPLTSYFINQFYVSQINRDNPIGSKGKLAQAYAAFIKNMWCEQQNVYRPIRIKNAVADINKMFSGYAQHDSQQFFSFLVDGLHEDLNRIKKKPYVQSVDSNGRSDEIVSNLGWQAYTQRNQSIITDMMVGQYKSIVTCPDCKKQSITFDPFITVTLPIPEKSASQLKLFVLYNNFEHGTQKISVSYRNRNIEQIFKKVAQTINKKVQQIQLYVLSFQDSIYGFHNTSKTQIFSKVDSYTSTIFAIQLSQEQQNLQNRIELTFRFSKKQYYSYKSFWFKRPFYFNFETVTGLDLVKRVLRYFYYDTYDYSQNRINKLKKNQQQREKQSYFSSSKKWRDEDKSDKSQGQAKTYDEYQLTMLNKRPFKIYLRSNKKIKYGYSHTTQVQFQQQTLIPDQTKISQIIDLKKINNYQIDVRFSSEGMQDFTVSRLKNYDQNNKGQEKSSIFSSYTEEKRATLDQCFQALETPELLEKGNQWYCSVCKQHKLATKQMYIYKTPEILILHFKRFKVKGLMTKQKNQTDVQFPLQIDMSKYIVSKQAINNYIPALKQKNIYIEPSYKIEMQNSNNAKYQLYAISNHYGSLGSGHYTAFAKNNQRWYSFNDSSVSPVETSRIRGSGAYMLFYCRKSGE